MSDSLQKLAYLYSRYPVISQTFCDSEMLALESLGFELVIGSLNPPPNTFRHERFRALEADVHYPPPAGLLKAGAESEDCKNTLGALLERHLNDYGESFKPEVRARNAYYFGRFFERLGVGHVHVHFANRATHTALFLREMGLPFSFTAHAQDFMVDLGSDDLLRELCDAAEFVVAVSDYSKGLLQKTCPKSADKIVRIYNGIDPTDFPAASPGSDSDGVLRILSVGRLIEFKGFHHLVTACGLLRDRGVSFRCEIIGEGPWRERLESQISELDLGDLVALPGIRTRDEVKRALAESDVFALPCIIDSKGASDILPTVITEAMACHLPVVSTKLVGVPEMVADGESGTLVEPGDAVGFADALEALANDLGKAKAFGEEGRKRMVEIFAQEKTSGQLAALFSEHAPVGGDSGAHVDGATEILVLAGDASAVAEEELAAFAAARGVGVLCADAGKPEPSYALLDALEFLPDATVLEAAWLFDPDARARCERLRSELGMTAVPGEFFFASARRAVYLAEILRKRPAVRHVHAARSGDVPVVWLAKKLEPRLRASFAVEENPSLPRSGLAKMLADFDSGTLSDKKLARMLESEADDELKLTNPPTHRRVRIGPIKFRVKNKMPEIDRGSLARNFVKKIRQTLR